MSDIGNTTRLWVVNRHSTFLVLAPGLTGTPNPVEPSPILHKAAYVSIYDANGDLRNSPDLDGPYVMLLAKFPSPDGPPAQTAILFPHQNEETISYEFGGRSFLSIQASRYAAAGPSQGYGWEGEIVQGRLGYFLIGSTQAANLWRVARVEVDYAQRYNFTLVPVALAHGLPSPDFGSVDDLTIRQEIQQHWSEVQDALIHNRYYGLVTAAKNVGESLLYYLLLAAAHISPGNRDMAHLLSRLDLVLRDADSRKSVPFDFLAYHLMQKIRILHGRTHIGRVVTDGRAITPDLALTVVSDLVEVLRIAGFVL